MAHRTWSLSPVLSLLWLWSATASAADRRTPVVEAVEAATPAVVTVEVQVERQNPFFGWGPTVSAGAGSGVIIHPNGLVLTNAHVVEGARDITVHTNDGGAFGAAVVAMEADLDLAVLQVEDAPSLPTIALGSSSDLMLGESVIAIGNAMGLGLTVSTGVVSSIRRDVEVRPGLHQSFIQTDAAINPGNSGGALVNIEGKLIGINTAIRQDAEGIGFAIPVDRARKIADDLVSFGSVRAPWLGLAVEDLDDRVLRGTPLADGAVVVTWTADGGPARAGGVVPGDLLCEVDGLPIASRADLNSRLAERAPGDRVAITLYRKGKRMKVSLDTASVPRDAGHELLVSVLGVTVAAQDGLLVVTRASAGGTWAKAHLQPGDAVVAADGRPLKTTDDLEAALGRARGQHRGTVLLTVRRGRYQGHVEVEI
ncbi:MAG: trypsin-like peptidase domain-containing protein [Myxococcota bacterium]